MSAAENQPDSSKFGYDLYPERKNASKSWVDKIVFGRDASNTERLQCEKRVLESINRTPAVKLLIGALETAGCPVDIKRHITCETCDVSVVGGYDSENNQIVVCQNVCTQIGKVEAALSHELIHMFDYCNNKADFKNIDHLACTEIRAANLTSCSFLTALSFKPSLIFNIGKSHGECVKLKAARTLELARKMSRGEAMAAVEKVFPKCYDDLEPFGLRPRRKSDDLHKAYRARHLYGYL